MSDCRIDGCARPARQGRRTCASCSHALARYGDPFGRGQRIRARRPEIERFMEKVSDGHDDGCWKWTGGLNHGGYGKFWLPPEHTVSSHTWSYKYFKGPIPDGLQIDHLCNNRSCVNPEHLEVVTAAENSRRRVARWRAGAAA